MKTIALLTVAGLRFYGFFNHKDDLTGKEVTFEPEPTNPYDEHAIKIMFDGKQMGHVPRTQTGVLHEYIGKGTVVKGRVTNHYPRAVVVQTYIEETTDAKD